MNPELDDVDIAPAKSMNDEVVQHLPDDEDDDIGYESSYSDF